MRSVIGTSRRPAGRRPTVRASASSRSASSTASLVSSTRPGQIPVGRDDLPQAHDHHLVAVVRRCRAAGLNRPSRQSRPRPAAAPRLVAALGHALDDRDGERAPGREEPSGRRAALPRGPRGRAAGAAASERRPARIRHRAQAPVRRRPGPSRSSSRSARAVPERRDQRPRRCRSPSPGGRAARGRGRRARCRSRARAQVAAGGCGELAPERQVGRRSRRTRRRARSPLRLAPHGHSQ